MFSASPSKPSQPVAPPAASTAQVQPLTFYPPVLRGGQRKRIALVGLPGAGKSTIFDSVASTAPQSGALVGTALPYHACEVQIGLNQVHVMELPSVRSLYYVQDDSLGVLQYLIGADDPPDLILQVIDATNLQAHLELTLELCQLGLPVVIALNHMDEARRKRLQIRHEALSRTLGVPVIPMVAIMGHGISELFDTAIEVIRQGVCPLPHEPSPHIVRALADLRVAINQPHILETLHIPHFLLLKLFAAGHPYFEVQLQARFPDEYAQFQVLRQQAQQQLPRPLADEIHADRHHRAATVCEEALCMGQKRTASDWRVWLDAFMLHPQWGLLSSILVFAGVLWMVFEGSTWIDANTTQLIVAATQNWQPTDTVGVVGRAVLDGFIGLIGIVLPYMIPLVLLLIALEEAGIMHRIAFVVDRGFHHIGLHGGVAVPFLLGLGCNVPAISAVARNNTGRERLIASVLITFVPCSARSAIILAIAGKYLGVVGVIALYALMLVLIAVLGKFMSNQRQREAGPGQVQQIPAYALPNWRSMVKETWLRTNDILTIVTPLLVGGSVVLALLSHWGFDGLINSALTPLTVWWLGLPLVLGLPLLFGVLRKELSLLMIFQALGTQELNAVLSTTQIATLLVFLTFYVPCVSTFAVMLKTLGAKQAWGSVALSVGVALVLALAVRVAMVAL